MAEGPLYPDNPTGWMRHVLHEWLQQPEAQLGLLTQWLQGHGLPPVGDEEEPYVWLLRGLPLGAERHQVETALARCAASLLDQKPDVQPVGDPPERLIYNLLKLCAGLRRRDLLAGSLSAVFKRRELAGKWMGLDLRYALRGALAMNQGNNRLEGDWETMLAGRPHEYLGGNPWDGLEGVLGLPLTADGRPELPVLGRALQRMAVYLEGEHDRLPVYRSVLSRLTQRFPSPRWDVDLVLLADEHQWPTWTVEALPRLNFRADSDGYFLWRPVFDVLAHGYSYQIQRQFCAGEVLQVTLDEEAETFVEEEAPIFEEHRCTDLTAHIVGVTITAICAALAKLSGGGKRAAALSLAHRSVLRQNVGLRLPP